MARSPRRTLEKSQSLGIRALVLPVDKSHGAINRDLGQPGTYTNRVDEFMASLDPRVRDRLGRR